MSKRASAIAFALLLSPASCKKNAEQTQPDHPQLTPNVTMCDVTFHSNALNRDMQYRVVFPGHITAGERFPVVYLLHGGGGNFRNWSDWSDVARYAERGLILVMPEGSDSYWANSAGRPQDRYEDYVVNDLISDVEDKFSAAKDRANRAIVGVSMGGFGAVKLALSHPDLFAFAGGISSAIDVPRRPFSIKRPAQGLRHRLIFGAWGSQTRRDNDPYILVRFADPGRMPYLFLSCGEQEGLLRANREFAALLEERHLRYEFHVVPGGHTWTQWNERLPSLFDSMWKRIHPED
jgi:S-formylglutathione hydrolase FrmB